MVSGTSWLPGPPTPAPRGHLRSQLAATCNSISLHSPSAAKTSTSPSITKRKSGLPCRRTAAAPLLGRASTRRAVPAGHCSARPPWIHSAISISVGPPIRKPEEPEAQSSFTFPSLPIWAGLGRKNCSTFPPPRPTATMKIAAKAISGRRSRSPPIAMELCMPCGTQAQTQGDRSRFTSRHPPTEAITGLRARMYLPPKPRSSTPFQRSRRQATAT